MEEMLKTLDHHTCSWLNGKLIFYKHPQGFWAVQQLLEGAILAQQSFKAEPTDVFLCSCPKTGTTWLKALAFAIATRKQVEEEEEEEESMSHLLTSSPHECIPFLERNLDKIEANHKSSKGFPLVATHLPYASLPESIVASNCKIVYIYRNTKDVIVSQYHFLREALKLSMEDAPFEKAFQEFCEGISGYGPYWDHILGYWKASLERPDRILFLKYEDLKADPTSNVKRLAEFIGYPFSIDEEKVGVVDNIIKLCSFENLSNLEVNKSGKRKPGSLDNRLYFRKAKNGDWEKYFTDEMIEKVDKLMDQKLSGTGLVLK